MAVEYLTKYIPSDKDIQMADMVSKWTYEAKTMLPKSTEDLLRMFTKARSVLLLGLDNLPVAHAAISFAWPNSWYEEGAVIVSSEMRGKGVGHLVVSELDRHAQELGLEKRMALCNPGSLPLFLAAGGMVTNDYSIVPNEVWTACADCPTKPTNKKCCDALVIMGNKYANTK